MTARRAAPAPAPSWPAAADGKLAEGERWVQQGILGSAFEGNYRLSGRGIAPRISGRAYITARAQLVIDPADPFAWGIVA